MKIVHTVKPNRIIPIGLEGIKRGGDLPRSERRFIQSNPNFIYLSVIDSLSMGGIETIDCNNYARVGGKYHFSLDLDWVRANIDHFKERAIYCESSPKFYEFVKSLGMGKDHDGAGQEDFWGNQVTCDTLIPIEGIEGLLIKGNPNSSKGDDLLLLEQEQRSKVDPVLLVNKNSVRIRDIIPERIAIYVGDRDQTTKIR